jgi:hypothetical protein
VGIPIMLLSQNYLDHPRDLYYKLIKRGKDSLKERKLSYRQMDVAKSLLRFFLAANHFPRSTTCE